MARRSNFLSSDKVDVMNDSVEPTSFEELLDVFLSDCELRNLRQHTTKYYHQELMRFKKILLDQGIDPTPEYVTHEIINQNIIRYMKSFDIKTVSINSRLRAIRAFFNYLYKYEHISKNPVKDLKLLRDRKHAVQTFSRKQINHLLRQPDLRTFTGVRSHTIMLLLLETGVRANELVHIYVEDIRWEDSMILIRETKGHRQRLVPFTSKMGNYLRKWLSVRGKCDVPHLFVTIDNTPLSKRQVQSFISKYGEMANIKGVRCSCHTFRHTFAKYCVEQGAGIFELQQILGHTSMEMVRTYVNLFSTDVRDKHKDFSPLKYIN